MKNFCSMERLSWEDEKISYTMGEIFVRPNPTKEEYPEHIKKSENSRCLGGSVG